MAESNNNELNELREEMIKKSISKLNEMLDELGKDSNPEDIKNVTEFHKSVVNDITSHEQITAENKRSVKENLINAVRIVVQAAAVVVPCIVAFKQTALMEENRNARLNTASKFENEGNAYLSMTDRTVVQDSLKEQRPTTVLQFPKIF